jgi:hypothetical protein
MSRADDVREVGGSSLVEGTPVGSPIRQRELMDRKQPAALCTSQTQRVRHCSRLPPLTRKIVLLLITLAHGLNIVTVQVVN